MKKSQQQKKKMMVLFCIFGLAFSAFMILSSVDINTAALMPGDEEMAEMQAEAEKLQKEADTLAAELKAIENRKTAVSELQNNYWRQEKHGDHEIVLREQLENFAKELNIKNPGFGTLRTSKITDSTFAMETDITFAAPLRVGLELVRKIEAMDASVYWKRFEMAVDQRGGTSSINWNLTLRIPAVAEDQEKGDLQ